MEMEGETPPLCCCMGDIDEPSFSQPGSQSLAKRPKLRMFLSTVSLLVLSQDTGGECVPH